MEVRRLDVDDILLLETAVRDLLAPEGHFDGGASRDHLAGALADRTSYFLVCVIDSVPVGFLSAYGFPAVDHDGCLAYLYDIVVRAEHRRRGIAARLLEALKYRCRTDGVTRIWVGTSLENHAARRAFEATGAVQVSETYAEYSYDLQKSSGSPTV